MSLTQKELELRALAGDRIDKKILPAEIPPNVWAGRGHGEPCSLCGQPVDPGEIEYELRLADERWFRFHLRCHAMWQMELTRRLGIA